MYKVTSTAVLADTRNGRWKAADHAFLSLLGAGTDPQQYGGTLYLSFGGDLTLSQQRYEAARADPSYAGTEAWHRAEHALLWNRTLARPLLGEWGCLGAVVSAARGRCWGSGAGWVHGWLLRVAAAGGEGLCGCIGGCFTRPLLGEWGWLGGTGWVGAWLAASHGRVSWSPWCVRPGFDAGRRAAAAR